MVLIYIIPLVLIVLSIWFISIYNELIKERILVKEAFATVSAGLQQRFDLVPNLVETVKGYAGHENKTLTEVIEMRSKGLNASNEAEQTKADSEMSKALFNMLTLSENYPELKANVNFQDLQKNLENNEVELNKYRRYYNGTVREYNQSIAVFPKNIIANAFAFKPEPFFEVSAESSKNPSVEF